MRWELAASGAPEHGQREDGVEDFERVADVLKALSHPVRLRIVSLLGSGELCVKRIEELVGCSQPSASQHLSRLRSAGLIESERRGHLVCYRLVGESTRLVVDMLLERDKAECAE